MNDKFLYLICSLITLTMCLVILLSLNIEIPADMPTLATAGTLITINVKIVDYFIKKGNAK